MIAVDRVCCFSGVPNFPDNDTLNLDGRSIGVIHLASSRLEVTDLERQLRLRVQGVRPENTILFQSPDVLGAVSQEYRFVRIDAGDATQCAEAADKANETT